MGLFKLCVNYLCIIFCLFIAYYITFQIKYFVFIGFFLSKKFLSNQLFLICKSWDYFVVSRILSRLDFYSG